MRMNNKGSVGGIITLLVLPLIILFVLFFFGILSGMLYFTLDKTESAIKTINFSIPAGNNSTINDFQDIASLIYYPVLGLRSSLVWITYFLIFGIIISFAVMGFLLQRHPVMYAVYIILLLIFTAISTLISNTYDKLLKDPNVLSMMADFVIYNKVVLYLPQFVFFTGMVFIIIGTVGVIKSSGNGGRDAIQDLEY